MSASETSVSTGNPTPVTVGAAPAAADTVITEAAPPSIVDAKSAAPSKAATEVTVASGSAAPSKAATEVTVASGSEATVPTATAPPPSAPSSVVGEPNNNSTSTISTTTNMPEGDHYFYFFDKTGVEEILEADKHSLLKTPIILVSSMEGFDPDGVNYLDAVENVIEVMGFNGYAAMNAILHSTRKTHKPKGEIMKLLCAMPGFPVTSQLILPTQLLFFMFLSQMMLYGKLQELKNIDFQTASFEEKFNYVLEETKKAFADTKPERVVFGVNLQTLKMGFKETEDEKEENAVSWWERVKNDTGSFAFVKAADVDLDDFITIFNLGPYALLELLDIENKFLNSLGDESDIKSVIKELQAYAELDEVAFESNIELHKTLKETILGIHSEGSSSFIFKDAAELIAKIKARIEERKAASNKASKKNDVISFDTEDEGDDDDSDDDGSDSGSEAPIPKKPKYPHGPTENAGVSKIITSTHPVGGPGIGISNFTSAFGKKPAGKKPETPTAPGGKKPEAPAAPGGKKPEAPAGPVTGPSAAPAIPTSIPRIMGTPPRILIPEVHAAPTDSCSKPAGDVNDTLVNTGPAVPCAVGGRRTTRKNR